MGKGERLGIVGFVGLISVIGVIVFLYISQSEGGEEKIKEVPDKLEEKYVEIKDNLNEFKEDIQDKTRGKGESEDGEGKDTFKNPDKKLGKQDIEVEEDTGYTNEGETGEEVIEETLEDKELYEEVEEQSTQSVGENTKTYSNCEELNKDYPDGVEVGHEHYKESGDRDKDGVYCESQ